MENKYGIVGVAHVGLPTNDLQKTVEFYKSLGFKEIMQTYNEKAGEKVAFLQIKNYCIETFENRLHIPQELRIRSRGTERHSASN